MEMVICNAEPNVEKKRKKKRKRRGSAPKGDHKSCDPSVGNASKDDAVPQESPGKICLKLETEGRQSHSKVILLREKNEKGWKKHSDLPYEEASRLSVLNVLNVKLIKKEDETSVSPNAELCSADGKENSTDPVEPDGRSTIMIKSDDEYTETIDHLAQPSHIGTQRRKKRKRRRKRLRAVETPKRSLESTMEDDKKVPLLGCHGEGEMTSTSPLKKFVTVEAVNGVLLEEVSIDCSANADSCSVNLNKSSMVFSDSHGSLAHENATMIKKDNYCLMTKDCLAQISSDDTHGITRRERRKGRRRKFADSLDGSLEPDVEDGKKDDPINCLNEERCSIQIINDDIDSITKRERKKGRRRRKFADSLIGSFESDVEDSKKDAPFNCLNEVKTTSLRVHSTTTERVKIVSLEESSVDCSIADSPLEIKERMDSNFSCKILEEEMKTQTKKQEVPHFLAYGATNDDVSVVVKNNSYSKISNSSKERDTIGCSKNKLLILDVNGLLVDFVPYFPDGYTPDIIISKKAVFKRPFCDDFLQFCFERFEVGVWSSRTWRNLNMLINFLLGDSRHKLLFCWDQSHCTTTRFTTIENNKKPLVLKELKKIWENLDSNLPWKKGEFDESNTLLLDDSPYKALRNPVNTAVFPASYQYKDKADTSLGPGGDLRVYLEGLSTAENVQKYVEQNPFGQEPISESNPSWKFYCNIINSKEEG